MPTQISRETLITEELALSRLDQAAAALFPDFSRARLQAWIKSGELRVNGSIRRAKDKVRRGEILTIAAELTETSEEPEDIPLAVLFEDEHLLIIDKSAGMVVHPGAGNLSGTMLNALLHHVPGISELPRAGIVHRLDKETSGLMVVAKSLESHTALVRLMQERDISRNYEALVYGEPPAEGSVDQPVGRHPVTRTRMAVVPEGKPALTHYRKLDQFVGAAYMQFSLVTGRTHQIRVHMAHSGYPLVGDPVYGGRFRKNAAWSEELLKELRSFPRQALHAVKLSFPHPISHEPMSFTSTLPEDISGLLHALGND